MICEPSVSSIPGISDCRPYDRTEALESSIDDAPTPINNLIKVLRTGKSTSHQSLTDIASLFGSLIMNGFPIIGMDDFVHLSDLMNDQLGPSSKSRILSMTVFQERFGNFLLVRSRQLRIAPANCWTSSFVTYLEKHSKVMKVRWFAIPYAYSIGTVPMTIYIPPLTYSSPIYFIPHQA